MDARDEDETDTVAAGPTWQNPIMGYFTATDIACMQGMGIDLGSYAAVVQYGPDIYARVANGSMPLGGTPWSATWVASFKSWMDAGYPEGAGAEAA